MLESRRFQGVLYDFRHFDDPLLQSIRAILLARSIPNEGSLSMAVRNVLGLSSLNLAVDEFLKGSAGLVCRSLNLVFRRPFHLAFIVV